MKFSDALIEEDDFDYGDWQKSHEEDFMKNWYKKREPGGANG